MRCGESAQRRVNACLCGKREGALNLADLEKATSRVEIRAQFLAEFGASAEEHAFYRWH